MTRVCVLPHLTAHRGVRTEPWTAAIGDELVSDVADGLRWDHVTPIELRSEVHADPDLVRADCGLSHDDRLTLVSTWHCGVTNVRRVGSRIDVDRAATYPITFVVDPALVDGWVTLRRVLVLSAAGSSPTPLAARRVGSVLWRDSPPGTPGVELRGAARRMTTDAVDFGQLPDLDVDSAWRLEVDLRDLHGRADHALRLLVNAGHPAIDHLLRGEQDEAALISQSVLRWDVARRLLEAALGDDDFVAGFGGFAPDSVGGATQQLLERVFPGAAPEDLRALRMADTARFESLLQARLRLLWTP